MAEEHNMRRVTAIKNGTVIDHIPAGQALKVLESPGRRPEYCTKDGRS